MRFVVDQPVSPILAEWLLAADHEAWHVRERGMSRAPDGEIFALAVRENAVIVTADLDFSRVLALSGRDRPGLILFRAGNLSDEQMLDLHKKVMAHVEPARLISSIVVVDRMMMRIAPLPIRPDL